MVKVNIKLTGNEENVLSFIELCAKIQLLSDLGVSAIIPVEVDGDGSTDLKFSIKAEVEGEGKIDMIDSWKKHNTKIFMCQIDNGNLETQYIGE